MRRLAFVVAIFCLVATLNGCEYLVREKNIPGTYSWNSDEGSVTLHLSRDGSFTEEVREKGKTAQHYEGTWEFEAGPNRGVYFKNFRVMHNGWGDFDPDAHPMPQDYNYPVGVWFGHVYLIVHVDEARHFEKVGD